MPYISQQHVLAARSDLVKKQNAHPPIRHASHVDALTFEMRHFQQGHFWNFIWNTFPPIQRGWMVRWFEEIRRLLRNVTWKKYPVLFLSAFFATRFTTVMQRCNGVNWSNSVSYRFLPPFTAVDAMLLMVRCLASSTSTFCRFTGLDGSGS